MKGYGPCRERYFLWAVPLLILDFAVLALFNAENPRCSVWSIGGYFFALQKAIVLSKQEANIRRAFTLTQTPPLHRPKRDTSAFCETGLR